LGVFFHICCLTFSFLPNVGLRLTLEYLTISPSSESHSSTTLIHSPSSGSILNVEYITHDPSLAQAINQRLWYHLLGESEGETPGRETRMRTEPTYIREWHHLQPKTLRHWVCGSSFLYVAQLSHFYSMWDLDSHLDT